MASGTCWPFTDASKKSAARDDGFLLGHECLRSLWEYIHVDSNLKILEYKYHVWILEAFIMLLTNMI